MIAKDLDMFVLRKSVVALKICRARRERKTNKIFVYGTLKRKYRRPLFNQSLRYLGNAKVEAKLYDLGEYPGAVEEKGKYVQGELYEAKNLEKILPILDEYEEFDHAHPSKSLFVRKVRSVVFEDGRKIPAIVYFYNGAASAGHLLSSGKWEEDLSQAH
jgi:gamma-glutamylcyclotransferase (GGCT)/AIG2-like uncharacterized protein YtfP